MIDTEKNISTRDYIKYLSIDFCDSMLLQEK